MIKKLISVFLLISFMLLSFVACSNDSDSDSDDVSADISLGKPYELVFESNGDGTCKLTQIKYNRDYFLDFKVEVPEKSPEGDTVVEIDLMCRIIVPRFIAKDDFDEIIETLEEKCTSRRTPRVFEAFYILKDPSNESYSDRTRAEILKYYPITQYTPIYVCELAISFDELLGLSAILLSAGYDSNIVSECTDALLESAKKSGADEEEFFDELAGGLEFCGDHVTEISLPSTVNTMSLKTICNFSMCAKLEKITGVNANCKVSCYIHEDYNGEVKYSVDERCDFCSYHPEENAEISTVDISELYDATWRKKVEFEDLSYETQVSEIIAKMGFDFTVEE